MTRARETADIVAVNFASLPRESCDLLREGAPIPPEPPVGDWKPEVWVIYHLFYWSFKLKILVSCCTPLSGYLLPLVNTGLLVL